MTRLTNEDPPTHGGVEIVRSVPELSDEMRFNAQLACHKFAVTHEADPEGFLRLVLELLGIRTKTEEETTDA